MSARPVLLVDGARNAHGRVEWWTMPELVEALTTVRSVGEKLNAPGWLPVEMVEGSTHRLARNVAHVWALVCDIDTDLGDFGALVQSVRGVGYAAIIHTTWSHTPQHPKARVVFPFEWAASAAEWSEVWASGAAWARTWGATVDQSCKDPSRLYFLPAVDAADYERRSEWFRCEIIDEAPCLSWRWLVAHHLPPAPKVIPPAPALTGAGQSYDDLDREQRRRRAFAAAVVRRRADLVVQAAPGKGGRGRNVYCYTGGRAVGQLVAAGVLDEAEGYHALVGAAVSAGLRQSEADRAIRNGIHRGKQEGAWDFSQSS